MAMLSLPVFAANSDSSSTSQNTTTGSVTQTSESNASPANTDTGTSEPDATPNGSGVSASSESNASSETPGAETSEPGTTPNESGISALENNASLGDTNAGTSGPGTVVNESTVIVSESGEDFVIYDDSGYNVVTQTNTPMCNVETLGICSGPITLVAYFEPMQYSCPAGQYLNVQRLKCEECLAGSYCPGFENVDYNGEDFGITKCPEGFDLSVNGATTAEQCYREAVVPCTELNPYRNGHGSAVYRAESGKSSCKYYYGAESVCIPDDETACQITNVNCDEDYEQKTIEGELWCVITVKTCEPGKYLPEGAKECVVCPENSYCSGGKYKIAREYDQGIEQCESELKSPAGASSINDCGHILRIEPDTKLYLHADKRTSPTLVVSISGVKWYADITSVEEFGIKTISANTTDIWHVNIDGKEYTVHDGTVFNNGN